MAGGGNDNAQREAQQAEQDRQRRISQTIGSIDQAYSNPAREAQYGDFLSANREFYEQDVNKQKATADRNLKFGLARSGLTGGSRATDAGTNLGEDYIDGLLEAERRAQGATADLRGADQQSKLNLISLANSGLDATTAARQAAEAMRSNLQSGMSTSRLQGLGDLFSSVADVNKASSEAKVRREAADLYGQSMYQPMWGVR